MVKGEAPSYKARKEAFVSNLSGSSISEINWVTLVAPAAIFLWTALQRKQLFFTPYGLLAFVADFLLNVCAILFATTVYSSSPVFLSIFLIVPGLLFLSPLQQTKPSPGDGAKKSKQEKTSAKASQSDSKSTSPQLVARPFLTNYRGAMMVVTCISILAVDFPIFPRRFAKVETWGTSLMDLGVGSFVFSAGVVSARSVVKDSSISPSSTRDSFGSRLFKSIRHSLPLFVLGLVRLYSVKGLDYAEHVTEYGVHWNFFFTLAFLPPFLEISDSLIRGLLKSYDVLALILAIGYEIVLNNTDLLRYILIAPRGPDLLSKNREGVFSFIGYLAIFLAGRGTGLLVVTFTESSSKAPKQLDAIARTNLERQAVLKGLLIHGALYSALYFATTRYYAFNLTVSRRLANLPYVLWVVAFNNIQIALFGLVEHFGLPFSYEREHETARRNASSKIMQVVNQNGLVIFLVANLLTGLVNLSINTLDMSNIGAMGILIAYSAAVTAFALALDMAGLKIKI